MMRDEKSALEPIRRVQPGTLRPRPWLIYESSDRWLRAVRRFATDFFDDSRGWSVRSGGPITSDSAQRPLEEVTAILGRRVVLWEVDQSNIAIAAATIAQARLSSPGDLQIAAIGDLTWNAQMALSETGIATSIRHPEHLPGLCRMIRTYFSGETTSHQPVHPSA